MTAELTAQPGVILLLVAIMLGGILIGASLSFFLSKSRRYLS
jgi:Tfp pilus assembly protein PilW